jgi:esterase/lipase superfamily enzyme
MCLAIVTNRTSVDDYVLEKTRKVALDTARGHSSEIAQLLYRATEGLEVRAISLYTSKPDDETRKMLRFMKHLEIVEPLVEGKTGMLGGAKTKWLLTPKLRALLEAVGVE